MQDDEINQQQFTPVIDALRTLFGRSQRQMAILKGAEISAEKYNKFDSIESRLSKVFTGYADIQYDRMSKYRDYDRMDTQSTECQTALDIYSEEASQKDAKTGLRVWVESEDEALASELNAMLQRVRMESKAYGIYRNLSKYGDAFLYLMLGTNGVHDTQFIHPSRIERKQEDGLLGFKSQELQHVLPMDNRHGLFKPWDFIHFRLIAYDQESIYGRSMLESLRKIWKQLSMLETMVVLYRVAKAVQRNIFYVDVGQASIQETQQLVKQYELFLKNKAQFVDPKTNEFKLDFNPATILQDVIWPTRPNSQSRVEHLENNANIGPLVDLDYFRTKIRSGLGIPKEYFDGEYSSGAWQSKEALMLQDVRFSRKVMKLQDCMREGIIKMCQIHLAITRNQYIDPSTFTVQLGTISDVAERQREDVLLRKSQILEILGNLSINLGWNRWVWTDYLLDEIFPLPSKLRLKLMTPDPVLQMEFEKQVELSKMGGMGAGRGAGKGVKPNKPPKKVTADNVKFGLRDFGYGGATAPKMKAMGEDLVDTEFDSELFENINRAATLEEVESALISAGLLEEGEMARKDARLEEDSKKKAMGSIMETKQMAFASDFIETAIVEFKATIADNSAKLEKVDVKLLAEQGLPKGMLAEGKSYDEESEDFFPEDFK